MTAKPRTYARNPHDVTLTFLSAREAGALSSDGVTVYALSLTERGWTCTCTGFAYRGCCVHACAAALPRCLWCDSTRELASYTNGSDNDHLLTLCAACYQPTR